MGTTRLVLERRRRARRSPGPGPGARCGPHGLGEVVGEALERLDRLAQAEHEHERRVGGQLDVDVVGGAQRRGDLVAGAAGAADVDHDPQRIPARDPGAADQLLADDRAARDRLDRLARPRRGGDRAVEQRLAVDGELAPGASSEAISSELGLVERTSRTHRATSSASISPSGGDVQHRRLGEAADDLVGRGEHRVGAEAQRRLGQRRVKAEVRAPGAVDDQRDARRRGRPRRSRSTSAAIP